MSDMASQFSSIEMASLQFPILIAGAGVIGLTLGQALRRQNIPFLIFERDSNPDARGQGWGVTIHWGLSVLESILPPELLPKIFETQVDPQQGRVDTGNFVYLNAGTCEVKYRIPPNRRIRVKREKLRRLLMDGIDVQVAVFIAPLRTHTKTSSGISVS